MSFNKFLIIPLLALFPAITACSDDCRSTCEDFNECAQVKTKVDCDAECDKRETYAEDAKCNEEYDDLISCSADVDDICKDDNSCATELAALRKCALPWCMTHMTQCMELGVASSDDDK